MSKKRVIGKDEEKFSFLIYKDVFPLDKDQDGPTPRIKVSRFVGWEGLFYYRLSSCKDDSIYVLGVKLTGGDVLFYSSERVPIKKEGYYWRDAIIDYEKKIKDGVIKPSDIIEYVAGPKKYQTYKWRKLIPRSYIENLDKIGSDLRWFV